jgi:thioredoxin-related protein
MKKLTLTTLLFCFLSSLISNYSFAEDGITFIKNDWSRVMEKSKGENKIIFVDVFATWCGPCKSLSATTFKDDEVGSFFNTQFINAKIDGESDEGLKFTEQFPVEAYPTMYFISPEGEVLKKTTGYIDAEELLSIGTYVLNPEKSPFNMARKKLGSGNYTKHDLFEYIMAASGEEKPYSEQVKEYLGSCEPNDLENDTVFVIYLFSEENLASPFTQYFGENYETFEVKYGEFASDRYVEIIESHIQLLAEKQDKKGLDDVYAFAGFSMEGEEYDEYVKIIEAYYEELINQ